MEIIGKGKDNLETRFDSFKGAEWANTGDKISITLGGLGSIGSWLALYLSRINDYKFYVYDFDTVEKRNLGGQFFRKKDLGKLKSQAVKSNLEAFSDFNSFQKLGEFKEDSIVSPYCFAGFDNAEARKMMFEQWKKLDSRKIFIDGRMDFETFQVLVVTKNNNEEWYQNNIDSLVESKIRKAACTLSSTTHIAANLAGYMTMLFTNYLSNTFNDDMRSLPKFMSFSAESLILKIEY